MVLLPFTGKLRSVRDLTEVSQPVIGNNRFWTSVVGDPRLLFSQFTCPLTGRGPGCPVRACSKPTCGRLGWGISVQIPGVSKVHVMMEG